MTSRVKLSFGDTRIVLPLSKIEGTTIASLLTTASTRFQSAGVLPVTDRFIEARTEDGYLLSDGDQIADVVGNDRISLINRAKWIEEFRAAESPEYWYVSILINFFSYNIHKKTFCFSYTRNKLL